MAKTIHFYFDFISPFAYLAHTVLPDLASKYHRQISYHVVNLAEIKRLAGNTGPSNRQIPLKRRYLQADKERWAARYGVPIANPVSFDPTRLNQGTFYAVDRGRVYDYVKNAWHLVWGKGGDMGAESLLAEVAQGLGWNASEMLEYAQSADALKRYAASTMDAHARGVFGVPTVVVDDQMWWGNDRLDFLEEYLRGTATK